MEAKLPQQISKLRTHVSAGLTNLSDGAAALLGRKTEPSKEELMRQTQKDTEIAAGRWHVCLLRCVALSCLIEWTAYDADSELYKIDDLTAKQKKVLDEERKTFIHYTDKYIESASSTLDATEDFMADYRLNLEKKFKRKLTAFRNAVEKQTKSLGIQQHQAAIAALATTMKMMETQMMYMNMTKQEPWYPLVSNHAQMDSAITMLELADQHCSTILQLIDPHEHKKPETNTRIDKLYHDILVMWKDANLYLSAVNYASKEQVKSKNK